jgi:EmrB/QacA subfamily drug resistance transporter
VAVVDGARYGLCRASFAACNDVERRGETHRHRGTKLSLREDMTDATPRRPPVRLHSTTGRWTIAATVLGSGTVFLEGTVVNVALPAVADSFGLGLGGVQWIVNGYLLTLSALMLLGGSLGDVHRRRTIFQIGLLAFAATSLLAAFMPSATTLVIVRVVQGAAGALLVPNSLAMVDELFTEEERGTAIGKWAGWSAISTAAGPLLGGWLVDALSWRWVFASAAPMALIAAAISARHVPDAVADSQTRRSVDYVGGALATLGLGGLVAGLITGSERGFGGATLLVLVVGVVLLVAFVAWQQRRADPLLPLNLFRSLQFSGANLATLFMYAALGAVFLFLVLQLQNVLHLSALETGAALMPINVLMLIISPRAGRLAERYGARWPMSAGALIAAVGTLLLSRVTPGDGYLTDVLPGVIVFGIGLSLLVAPLTAAVLAAVPERSAGIASAVNNAVARLAGLLAVAALPLAAGIGGIQNLEGEAFAEGYARVMLLCAVLCIASALVALITVKQTAPVAAGIHPGLQQSCAQRRPLVRRASVGKS